MKRKIIIFNLVLLTASILLCECLARFFVKPSNYCYGKFFGLELGPCNMRYFDLQGDRVEGKNVSTDVVVNGQQLYMDDLMGAPEDHPVFGYTYKRNYRSVQGWWQSNNVGARRRQDATREVPSGYQRIMFFGDSFVNGRGVPQEETWPYYLEQLLDKTEALNFGVNGYSTTQSYLRYQSVSSEIDYDQIIFVVGLYDFIREINVSRCLMGWIGCRPMPRFILEDGRLTLVKSPYPDRKSYQEENADQIGERLKGHLRLYDRFYFPGQYDPVPVFLESVLYKVFTVTALKRKMRQLHDQQFDPESEAFLVTRTIFRDIDRREKAAGRSFKLVILPQEWDVNRYREGVAFRERWQKVVNQMCGSELDCLDLMGAFSKLSSDVMDQSYDESHHYGPKVNRVIAGEIDRFLSEGRSDAVKKISQ